jgi:hypothetical protein
MFCYDLGNNNFKLKSIVSNKLTNNEIEKICFLKDKQWKFGIKSQIKWFECNIKRYDIHNLLYIKSKLIGYTLLRKRTCEIKNLNKKNKYLLFDTLIIDKKYRGNKLSNLLMNFNNATIKHLGYFSFLICNDKLVNFYKKNKWKKLNHNNFDIADHPFVSNGMVFNKNSILQKIIYYINK